MDPTKSQSPQEAKLHFLDYWRIIRTRKTVILLVFLLVVLTATLVTLLLPATYSSFARIRVERDVSDIPGLMERQAYMAFDPYFIQTEFEVIQSEQILSKVVDLLNLNAVWGRKYGGGQPLKTLDSIGLLRGRLSLKPVRNTSLIEIRVYSEDKDEAAKIAQAIAEVYRDYRQTRRLQLSMAGVEALEKRFSEHEAKIQQVQKELDLIRETNKISDLDAAGFSPTPTLEADVVRRILASKIESETRLIGREELLAKLRALPPEQLPEVLPRAVPDPILPGLINDLNTAEQRLVVLQKEYSDEHPEMVRTRSLVADLRDKIQKNVAGLMKALEAQVESARAEVEKLNRTLEEAKQTDIERAAKTRPYYDKKRELESLVSFRRILEMKIASERIDINLPKTSMVEIIDNAVPNERPVRPNKPLNILLSIIIGLVVGVGLAFFIEYLDTSVKTIDDVERALQAPVLGVIPQNVGLLIEEGAESPHAEAYRVLRTNLLFSRKDDKLNTVVVVSAGAGEGKTTTVLNLATVFAQSGQRVVIVDSDLRRPALHKLLRLSNSTGLTNYLLKQNSIEEVIQKTSLPLLDFISSGKLPSSSLGILSSAQMKDLISELKRHYDFVFFDSPPIMGVSDASILASEVDLTLQVIQYRRYPQQMTIRAKQLIEKVGGNLVGIVLNNINVSQDESYYYYSGYYHDYYYRSEEAIEPASGETKERPGIKQKY
ncbi:MAG: polysaccharide biosynthesis tyrosine autokinase [Verrucomicrobiae bacterium]|nr:polysaccharide biosynthesis tyrosine autokinase [Verrucomicrobiae bacterium]